MITRLKDQLADDKTCLACWSGFQDPQLTRLIAQHDYHAIVLDAQHGFHDETSLLNCIQQIVSVGKSALVRLPLDRWDLVQRVLDFGALGVIAPMINTGEDAKLFAESAKYPGVGARSFAPRYAAALYDIPVDQYLVKSQDHILCLPQIETKEAYDNLDDILAVEGVDGILLGPSDFSIFVTGSIMPDAYGPDTVDLVKDIAERTRAAGKVAACFTLTPEHAKLCHEFGYRLISIGMDSSILAAGAAANLEPLKGL